MASAAASSGFGRRGRALLSLLALALLLMSSARRSAASPSRRLMELYRPPAGDMLRYHDGAVLSGDVPVSVLWYGRFTPAQKAVVTDFLLSLSPAPRGPAPPAPSVAQWWGTINRLYLSKAAPVGKNGARGGAAAGNARVVLAGQVSDEACSLGKSLKLSQLPALAAAARPAAKAGGIALVLTAQDVAVEGFCASRCGHHGSYGGGGAGSSTRAAYVWVGNPAAR